MRQSIFYVLSAVVLCTWSCEKVLLAPDQASTDPYINFDYLWEECQTKYAYTELKAIDWTALRMVYRDKLYAGMSEDSLFQVLGAFLRELRDDHVNLVSDFNTSFFGVDYQGPDNFDWRILVDHYVGPYYYQSGPFRHEFLADGRIGYVNLAAFPGTIDAGNLDFVLNRYRATEGLILDLRENGGGAIADVFRLLSRFVTEETVVFYTRIKNGPAQNAFSPPVPVWVQPHGGTPYTQPVIVLTDRGTYSSGSLVALAAKALPQLQLVGDTTGGGLGIPGGGQLPNGWRYRFSVTQTLDLNQQATVEFGVPPDIAVRFDWAVRSEDEVLEQALEELL